MDLQELSDRTGVPKRKLRYVLDNRLIPNLKIEIAESESGRPRKFHWDVGFAIYSAAQLLVSGLGHESIREFLRGLVALEVGGKPLLRCLFERYRDLAGSPEPLESHAYWGDGVNFRVTCRGALEYDSRWRVPDNPAPIAADYEPIVQIVLDLGQILEMIASE